MGRRRQTLVVVFEKNQFRFDIAPLTGMLDVYSLTNSSCEINFSLRTGSDFRNIIPVLNPRTFKKGFRWQF